MARVLVAAGASGGHVYPALATAVVLRDRGHEVVFAGGDRIEARVVPEAGFVFHSLPVRRPPSVRVELLTPRGLRALGSITRATWLARRLLARVAPDVVLGMGGFVSVPVALAAGWGRPALVLHEQNANLSLAQRIPLRWADVLALGLPLRHPAPDVRTEIVGHPVRAGLVEVAELDETARQAARLHARRRLGLQPDVGTLLVFGGSLGSGPLNELVPTSALPAGIQVIHLAGPERDADVRAAWSRSGTPAVVLGYLDTIEDAYLAADVSISRSGASTVAEVALLGLPSILVPLPTLARGDQEANARVLERAGAATVISQSTSGLPAVVGAEVSRLMSDDGARGAMAAAGKALARPDAADRLADVIESFL
ncbi:MAG: UDP-N-acetylglucosamine--N-acetylmuramyl-(pentapeptide) pyrophosphoryl-undecaprenol N-acetylglucosamine transferase [Actinomycetota bacterium]